MAIDSMIVIDDENMTPEQVADAIRDAVGATKVDQVVIVTPQFDRSPDDPMPTWTPRTREDFESLAGRTDRELREIGLRPWGDVPEGSGKMIWLFPWEWYDDVPEGLPIVDIFGDASTFQRGWTDSDKRFGLLSFGIQKVAP
jgi:hypothetical protein